MIRSVITRKYKFSAAHRLEGHPKCGRPHGHNYVLEVSVSGEKDRSTGMLIDFANLDAIIKPIVEKFDHMWLYSADNVTANCPYTIIARERSEAVFVGTHSTCECMIEFLYGMLVEGLSRWTTMHEAPSLNIRRLRLWETENGMATFP